MVINYKRLNLHFDRHVKKAFQFLSDFGFVELECLPSLVRYKNQKVIVEIYHGRNSYEVGFEIIADGYRYPLSVILKHENFSNADDYRLAAVTTEKGVAKAVTDLSCLVNQYAKLALYGDNAYYTSLAKLQQNLADDYALDVLVRQLRPKAAEAFKRADYNLAVELYSKIRERLTATELKKLSVAEERSEA